jgi:hypothetical protein
VRQRIKPQRYSPTITSPRRFLSDTRVQFRNVERKNRNSAPDHPLECWPGMPLTHSPDFAAFRLHAGNMNSIAPQNSHSFMWPSINQDDMGEPRNLPLFLNARGRNHQHVFAAVDVEPCTSEESHWVSSPSSLTDILRC